MVGLLAVALVPLLTPLWIHPALELAGASVPGGGAAEVRAVSDQTVRDLLLGGQFAIAAPDGSPMYTSAEAAHLRDVRVVLYGFLVVGAISLAVVAAALGTGRRDARRWRSLAFGGAALVVVLAMVGVVGALAFGLAFELFHRLLFPGGNWAFGADSNLIALYPIGFWQLSAAAYGLVAGAGGVLVWLVGRRRARRLERS